jgi:hypothetical protein
MRSATYIARQRFLHYATTRRNGRGAWSVDRLGRSIQGLLGVQRSFTPPHRPFQDQQGLATTTPSVKAMFKMMTVFGREAARPSRERPMILTGSQ